MKSFVNFLSAFRIASAFAIISTLFCMYWHHCLISLTDIWPANTILSANWAV